MTGEQRWVVAVVVVAVLLTALLLIYSSGPEGTGPEPPPPSPRAAPRDAPKVVHLPRPGLSEDELPPPKPPAPPDAPLSVEDRAAFNKEVSRGTADAKVGCIDPWLEKQPAGASVEIVINARVYDGELIDVELRTLQELPEDVIDCVRDALWARPWPTAETSGDLRFQETLDASRP